MSSAQPTRTNGSSGTETGPHRLYGGGTARDYWRRVAIVAVLTALATVVLAQLLAAAVDADDDFIGLQPGPVAVSAILGVVVGALMLLALRRFTSRPVPIFLSLVTVGTLLSLAGPLQLLDATQAEQPGVSDDAALALIPLHVLVAVGVVVGLLGPARGRRGR